MESESYLVRATRRVFSDGTAWWRVVVLAALQMVPIVNWFTMPGYVLMVMRDAAWGVDRGLPRFSDYREILKNGVNAFVVSFVWGLVLVPVLMILVCGAILPSISQVMSGATTPPPMPWWLGLEIAVPYALLSIFIHVAWLRTAVYTTSSAGLSLAGVRRLIGSNSTAFRSVAWIALAAGLIAPILALPAALLTRSANLPAGAISAISYASTFIFGILGALMSLIVGAAYGIWASDPGPSSWPPLNPESALSGQPASTEAAFWNSES